MRNTIDFYISFFLTGVKMKYIFNCCKHIFDVQSFFLFNLNVTEDNLVLSIKKMKKVVI